jgi:prepilin-type N-terminal cleavage/methylation domain-containing protein
MFKIIHGRKGFTLVEVLVTIVIVGIVSTATFKIFDAQSKIYSGEQKVSHNILGARILMAVISKYVRSIGHDPQETGGSVFGLKDSTFGTSPITSNTSIYFTKDDDADGVLDKNSSEMVALNFDSANSVVQSASIDASGKIAQWHDRWMNVTSFSVDYVYEDGTSSSGTTNLPDNTVSNHTFDKVTAVVVTLTTRSEKPHDLTKTFSFETISSTVLLRNRKIAS